MKKIIALTLAAAMLLVLLTGCNSSDYKKATELYQGGNYEEAAQMFEALGDYKDSADQALVCRYENAQVLFKAGEFTQAADAFAQLGDYQDSANMVKECGYRNAEALLSAGSYVEAIAAYEALGDYKDSAAKLLGAKQEWMYIAYADVFAALSEGVWFYEAASSNAVNILTFTRENATLGGVSYSSSGPKEIEAEVCGYVVDEAVITITTLEGELTISYTMEGSEVVLEPGVYFTPAQVEEGLQGYWSARTSVYITESNIGSFSMRNEYIYCFDNGAVSYERAATAYISDNGYLYTAGSGGYYYFGPYQGTYKVTEKGLEADITNGKHFGFSISGGQVVMLRSGSVCQRCEGFKGRYGFKF